MKFKLIKKIILVCLTLSMITVSSARNTVSEFSIEEALQRGYDQGVITKSVRLYFRTNKSKKYKKVITRVRTTKKTNAFGKSDKNACQWAFLSAIKSFQAKAKKVGGRAVVGIVSNYQNHRYSSSKKFQCGAGNVVAGVSLKGVIVRRK